LPSVKYESMYDVIIAGGGIAGACAAVYLSRVSRVLLLEAHTPASGASGVAAGMVNPLMGRRSRPVWRMPEALDAFHELLNLTGVTGLYTRRNVLRPVMEAEQVRWFQEAAAGFPEHAQWLSAEAVHERYPDIRAPSGAILITSGGALTAPAFVQLLLQAAARSGAEIRTDTGVNGWGESQEGAWVEVQMAGTVERLHARRVVLALGSDWSDFPELTRLNLHHVKGQVVRTTRPSGIAWNALPHLAGKGYIVIEEDSLVIGSSFEHTFKDVRPSRKRSYQLIGAAAYMLRNELSVDILEETAGIRVEVPGTRLPMVGPLPGREHVWLFTGFGSKGLLLGPVLARDLSTYFKSPDCIPAIIHLH
jgi:glycine/D-amino acid oxidase-like deaminating enzyme